MISIVPDREIELMRRARGPYVPGRALAGSMVKPGVSTLEIDHAVRDFISSHGAEPSFLNYSGYPGSACISINEVVIHGIPDHRKLLEGDIVSVDVGAYLDGFHGDCCGTFACGTISPEARRLIDVTRQSFFEGSGWPDPATGSPTSPTRSSSMWSRTGTPWSATLWAMAWAPSSMSPRRSPISAPPDTVPGSCPDVVLAWACSERRRLGGPGPERTLDLRHVDGSLAAHYENTILITEGEPELLTPLGGDV